MLTVRSIHKTSMVNFCLQRIYLLGKAFQHYTSKASDLWPVAISVLLTYRETFLTPTCNHLLMNFLIFQLISLCRTKWKRLDIFPVHLKFFTQLPSSTLNCSTETPINNSIGKDAIDQARLPYHNDSQSTLNDSLHYQSSLTNHSIYYDIPITRNSFIQTQILRVQEKHR